MRKVIVLFSGILLGLLLAGCTQSFVKPDAQPAGEAGEEFARIVNLTVEGAMSGDDSKIREYLAEGAYGAELSALLAQNGVEADTAAPRALLWFSPLPQFSRPDKYCHGDVLLSRSVRSLTSNLLAWLLLAQYTHCGVLNQAIIGTSGDRLPDVPCVLSATQNEDVSGVTYETWRDWSAATTVTVLRPKGGPELTRLLPLGLIHQVFAYDSPYIPTEYAFVLNVPGKGLVPVPGTPSPAGLTPVPLPAVPVPTPHLGEWTGLFSVADYGGTEEGRTLCAHYWYCSKTTWWAYRMLGVDIEYNHLIDVIDRAVGIENSGFYQLYKLLFGVSGDVARAFCYFANDVCVWPDEIRWAGDGLPWTLTRYAPPEHPLPNQLAKAWTWGLPAY